MLRGESMAGRNTLCQTRSGKILSSAQEIVVGY
jgi:hypothetical protein